jgi:hypothetical protein
MGFGDGWGTWRAQLGGGGGGGPYKHLSRLNYNLDFVGYLRNLNLFISIMISMWLHSKPLDLFWNGL